MVRYKVLTSNGKYILVSNLTKAQAETIKRSLPASYKASIKSYTKK